VLKARQVLAELQQKLNFVWMEGKSFELDRSLLRFPATYRYQLLCWRDEDGISALVVLSHEAYNAVAENRRRV
jgi:hypothetical protein